MKKLRQMLSRKKYKKQVNATVMHAFQSIEDDLATANSQTEPVFVETTALEKLMHTLDDVYEGKGTKQQKVTISTKVIQLAPITEDEKSMFLEQLNQIYNLRR